jgi:hypothetical protein
VRRTRFHHAFVSLYGIAESDSCKEGRKQIHRGKSDKLGRFFQRHDHKQKCQPNRNHH